MTSPEDRWATFRFGDAFPADSVTARWAAGMTLIANDLLQVNLGVVEASDAADDQSSQALYLFWLACAHYREAAHFMQKGSQVPEIRESIARLPEQTREHWAAIQKSFEPWEGSLIQTMLKPLRDNFFHYPKPTDQKWGPILTRVADRRSGVRVRGSETVGSVRGVFADDLRAELLSQYMGVTPDELGGTMRVLADLIGKTVLFAHEVLVQHLQSLPDEMVQIADGIARDQA
jgi:hypothetical protein